MSCYSCGAIIDCGEFGGITPDLAPSRGFFATQGYTFILDCPPGYSCFPGYWPRVIDIPKDTIPEVIVTDGGNFSIYGCQGMVTVPIPIGISQAQTQLLVNNLFETWAFQQAQCKNKTSPGPGIPAPTLITGNTRTDVNSTEQCYTAHCNPESSGSPKSFCTPPGYMGATLFNATPDQIAAAQAQFNAAALDFATKSATTQLTCGVCNAFLHTFQACAGDPSKVAVVDIPAGKYCEPAATGIQERVDALASIDAVTQLNAALIGMGCVCPGPTIDGALTVYNVCVCQYRWSIGNAYTTLVNIGAFNANNQWQIITGNVLHGATTLSPQNCPGPVIKLYFP